MFNMVSLYLIPKALKSAAPVPDGKISSHEAHGADPDDYPEQAGVGGTTK